MGKVAAAQRRHGVSGTARSVDDDPRGHVLRFVLGEAEIMKDARDVRRERFLVRVLLLGLRIEILLGEFSEGLKAVVPNVLRLELSSQALLDLLRDLWDQSRSRSAWDESSSLRRF